MSGLVDGSLSIVGCMGAGNLIQHQQLENFPKFSGIPIEATPYRPASSSMSAHLLKNRLIAEEISGGHAFENHVVKQLVFPGFSKSHFKNHLRNILNKPSDMKGLSKGRTGYWDQKSGTVIIRDPSRVDGGTAFRPLLGKRYFDEILK